jgi:hypothetical protein
MNINEYVIAERAVWSGVADGVNKLLADVESFKNPELVVDTIAAAVISELCDVINFGINPINFTPSLMKKIWDQAKEEEKEKKEKKD